MYGDPVGISIIDLAKVTMDVYPNPVADQLNINYSIPVNGQLTIEMVDILGQRKIQTNEGTAVAGEYLKTLNVNQLASGQYILLLRLDGEIVNTRKVVIR